MKKPALVLFLILCFYLKSSGQNTPVFRQYFYVEVSDLKSAETSAAIKQKFLADSRFISCEADFEKKGIAIIARKGIQFSNIQQYLSKFGIKVVRYWEKYSADPSEGPRLDKANERQVLEYHE